jgi:hypothetical protein
VGDNTEMINAVVARCLIDGSFAQLVDADPAAAWNEMNAPASAWEQLGQLDCDRLALVAGFIANVKHSELWKPLFGTRSLLRHYGRESDVFSAYCRARGSNAKTVAERVVSFAKFLTSYLFEHGQDLPILADVLQHEATIATFNYASAADFARPSPTRERDDEADASVERWQPSPRGLIRVQSYQYDPVAVLDLLSRGEFHDDTTPIAEDDIFLCYARGSLTEPSRVFHMDPATALVVGAVDGHRTVLDIIQLLPERIATIEMVRTVLVAVAEAGLVESLNIMSEARRDVNVA